MATSPVVTNSVLVFFMQTGFSLLECGAVRAKNSKEVFMKNFVDVSISSLAWWALGYALSTGGDDPSNHFIDGEEFFPNSPGPLFFYGFVFCSTSTTIVSGAMAERTRFVAYMMVTAVLAGFVYPTAAFWVWSRGFLREDMGDVHMLDFAGSSVVHCIGGTAALVGAYMVGPRMHRFDMPDHFQPHNANLFGTGVFILWTSWFAFNTAPAYALGFSAELEAEVVARCAANTLLAPAAAIMVQIALTRNNQKQYDMCSAANACLAGTVSITAGCAYVDAWAAAIIGGISAFVSTVFERYLFKFRVDDPVSASAVHLASGAWGTIAVGLFATRNTIRDIEGMSSDAAGVFMGGDGSLLGVQLLGLAVIVAWTAFLVTITLFFLKWRGLLRVREDDELAGLDYTKHGGTCYPEFRLQVLDADGEHPSRE